MKISMALGIPAMLLSALIVGCGEKEEKKPAKPAETPATETKPEKKIETGAEKSPGEEKKPEAAGDTKALTFGKGERKWTVKIPLGWKEEEVVKPLRLAQVRVPKKENDPEDAEVTTFQMSGGSVQQNLDRWAGQFGGADSQKSKKNVKTAAGIEAVVAEYEGNYTAMVDGAPEVKKDYKMLGAIIELEGGGQVFIKFIGPLNTIDAAKGAFDKMIESFNAAK